MIKYACGFYRRIRSFDEETVRKTLRALSDLNAGFFPATLWTSKEQKIVLRQPGDYARSLLPSGYFITPELATIPLDAANGAVFTFTESASPQTMPASLVIEFTSATLSSNAWDLERLLALFKAIIGSFEPDYGHLSDEAHLVRESYTERMFEFDARRVPTGLFWINYYGAEWARSIGKDRLERLRPSVASLEWLDNGGALIAIQKVPYDESNAAHREHQLELERLLRLEELQASFPNPGV